MDELIKKLAEERDEWRDKFHALNQTAGELCNACGWAFKIPGESCRCEVIKERDEARAETARLRRLLNMAEDELIAADDHGRREAKRADTVEAEVEALKAERDKADELATLLEQYSIELRQMRAEAATKTLERDEARRERDVAQRELARLKSRPAEAEIGRLDVMWQELVRDRDKARAEVEHAYREGGALYEAKIAEREAFRSGAEAMREACAVALMANGLVLSRERAANVVRALPIPEEP